MCISYIRVKSISHLGVSFSTLLIEKNLSSCHYFLVPPLTLIKLYILEKYLKFMRRDRSKNGHTVY